MTRVAIFVSENCWPPSADDSLLLEAVRDAGGQAEAKIWDQPNGTQYDVGIIRATWDYDQKSEAYRRWLKDVSQTLTLLNPLKTLLWSLDKRYLLELAGSGASTIPTRLVTDPSSRAVAEVASDARWNEIVVKSVVSAGGRQVARARVDDPDSLSRALTKTGTQLPVLVQPYMDCIRSGEYSLIFLDGKYSHSVLKIPAHDTFLVQRQYGGAVEAAEPTAEAIEVAGRALALVAHPWVYARVDLMVDEALGPLVVELELLEPELFLRFAEGSAQTLAEAILRRA